LKEFPYLEINLIVSDSSEACRGKPYQRWGRIRTDSRRREKTTDYSNLSKYVPGVAYCAVIAMVSFVTWRLYRPVSCLMWAFIFGIVVSNLVKLHKWLTVGANFCSSRLLKATIALLRLVTSAMVWFQVGIGVVNALVVIAFSFFTSVWLGRRFGISDRLALLIGVGTSICGASAIAATAPALEAREEELVSP